MTDNAQAEMVGRLRATYLTFERPHFDETIGENVVDWVRKPINPDGPEAADALERMAGEVAALREALERISSHQTKCIMPWTHEIAADTYSADLDRMRNIARQALATSMAQGQD